MSSLLAPISRPTNAWVRLDDEKKALQDLFSPHKSRGPTLSTYSLSSYSSWDDKSLEKCPKTSGEAIPSPEVPPGLLVPLSRPRAVAATITLSGGSFLHGFTMQAMFILMPTIKRDLNIPALREGWLTSSYALGFSSSFLMVARLGDVYGHRTMFLSAAILALLVLVVNPFLRNEWAFFVARGVHGVAAATLLSNLIGVRNSIFAPGRRRKHAFMSCWMAIPLGNAMGNITSGVLAEYANWRYVFLATSLIAFIIIAGTILFIPTGLKPSRTVINAVSSKLDQTMRLDWIGALLWFVGILVLLLAITEVGASGLSDSWVPVFMAIAALLIGLFFFWEAFVEKRESKTPNSMAPLIRLSIFRGQPPLIGSIFVVFFIVTAFNGFLNMTTSYFQTYQALDPLDTALRFIPTGVVGFCTLGLITQVIHRISVFATAIIGATAVAVANLVMALPISPQTSYFAYNLPTMITAAFGMEFIYVTLARYTASRVEDDDSLGAGINVMVAQLGRATGVAITTALRITVVRYDGVPSGDLEFGTQASLDGLKVAFWTNSWFAWAAVWVVLLVMRKQGPQEPNINWTQAPT